MNPNLELSAHDTPRAAAAFHVPMPVPRCTASADEIAAAAVARLRGALDEAFAAVPPGVDPSQSQCPEFARLMRAALAHAAVEDALLTPAQREGAANGYRRHLLLADPKGRYAAAALVWQPGQASPVHGHHTWCGYAVLDGVLHETLYTWDDAMGCAAPSRVQPREAGAVSYVRAGLNTVHRLGNDGTRPAVSLHVYGVCGEQLATHVNRPVRTELELARNER